MKNEMLETCAFCGERASLLESHVLPAFVFRWLKDTSATGFLRFGENPAKRVQDGIKQPWFCKKCEALFNRFETPFATNLFYPYCRDDTICVRYQEWLAKFCASVSWRVLKFLQEKTSLEYLVESQRLEVSKALESWRAFVSGEIPHPGKYEQHLLLFGPIESTTVLDMPDNINRYFMRGVEFDLPSGDKQAFTYAKMGRFAVFGIIQSSGVKWQGTRVAIRSGVIQPAQFGLPIELIDYLKDRAKRFKQYGDSIPDHQQKKIETAALKDIERFFDSDEVKAMLHDERMFGVGATFRKSK